MKEFFSNRVLIIATKHGKEKFLAPIFNARLGLTCRVAINLDTDQLGTFTGEQPRLLEPQAAARRKCELALELENADLALASEGSFGIHPLNPFVPANEEWLYFLDRKNNLQLAVREVSFDTNYACSWIESEKELEDFAAQVNFPSHALILRVSPESAESIQKGISSWVDLFLTFHNLHKLYGKAYVETDMRAMHNPARQQVITKAALQLVARLESTCPVCNYPGFGVISEVKGLPCALCRTPTQSLLKTIVGCIRCGHRQELNPEKKFETPQYCDVCNP